MFNAALVSSLLLVACAPPHRTFTTPPSTLTPDQRVAAFHTLRPVSQTTVVTTSCSRGGCSSSEANSVELANGTEVHYAEDLAPLVFEDSATTRHIRAATDAERRHSRYTWIGFGGFLLGAGIVMSSFIATDPASELDTNPFTTTQAKIGYVVLGASMVTWLIGHLARGEMYAETRAAYKSYPTDLATRLAVCAQGLGVAPCEQVTNAPGATVPTLQPGAWPGVNPAPAP